VGINVFAAVSTSHTGMTQKSLPTDGWKLY